MLHSGKLDIGAIFWRHIVAIDFKMTISLPENSHNLNGKFSTGLFCALGTDLFIASSV